AHEQTFRPEDYAEMVIDFADADWEIWQCRGCEEVTFKEEIVKTFNDGAYVLCAGGLRALLEGICVDQGVTSGPTARGANSSNLEGKINGLKTLPNVPAAIVDSLHGFRFLGNTALHRLSRPPAEDLAMAIEV